MNLVKNKTRNKLSTKTLNSIILIRNQLKLLNKNCHTYELPEIVLKTNVFKNNAVEVLATENIEEIDSDLFVCDSE